MPSPSLLLAGYAVAALLLASFAHRRGRSLLIWLALGLLLTPAFAAIVLWFLPDLVNEQQRTREFLNQARQRRHRRDPHDTFSRTREHQELEIQEKVSTARLQRQWMEENVPPARTLRARTNRTPITAIMDGRALHAPVRRRVPR